VLGEDGGDVEAIELDALREREVGEMAEGGEDVDAADDGVVLPTGMSPGPQAMKGTR